MRVLSKYSTTLLSASKRLYSSSTLYKEVKIPVPWGHIAGRWWGPENQRPILCLHGWQDNCATHDLLIPKLPKHLSFLAIDAPGHGHSSHLPPGMFYHLMNNVILIKQLKDYFKWDKLSLMSHSLGAIASFTYGATFPDDVDFVVCIEGMQPLINKGGVERFAKTILEFNKLNKFCISGKQMPAVSLELMAAKMVEVLRNNIDEDKCKVLLSRNTVESKKEPGKYHILNDPRIKAGPLTSFSESELKQAAERFTAPLLSIKAADTGHYGNEKYFQLVHETLQANNKNYTYVEVRGMHYIHLNNPDAIKDLITDFILKYDKQDRRNFRLNKELFII